MYVRLAPRAAANRLIGYGPSTGDSASANVAASHSGAVAHRATHSAADRATDPPARHEDLVSADGDDPAYLNT